MDEARYGPEVAMASQPPYKSIPPIRGQFDSSNYAQDINYSP